MGSSLDLKPLETPCMLEKEERDQQPLVRVCQNIVRAEAWFLSLIRCHHHQDLLHFILELASFS